MQDPRDLIVGPIVSEKSYSAVKDNRYSFFVNLRAEKGEIKKAIEKIFNVKVLKISTISVKPKPKRLGRSIGTSPRRKKAIVSLRKKDKIDFFQSA